MGRFTKLLKRGAAEAAEEVEEAVVEAAKDPVVRGIAKQLLSRVVVRVALALGGSAAVITLLEKILV
jgi:hypothetical protein